MARVALRLLLLLSFWWSSATAQYGEDYYIPSSGSGSGSGDFGDPTLTDYEGGGDDYNYFDNYEFPYEPNNVDICNNYPLGQ